MKECDVGAFARSARRFALAAVALFVSATALHAQATGKLEGRVRDQAGAPIAGAQVRIVGTAFGAVADTRGYYFINNVPAGTHDLIGQFVGYKPVQVTGLRVPGGQTVTQDFALEQQAVDIGEIEVTAAVNVLVPRDAVTTKQNINGEFTNSLPVDRLNNVLALQPGVVASASGNTLTIRGGRSDEAVTYIDGVPVSPGTRGNLVVSRTATGSVDLGQVQVSTNAFEDASVTTGALSSEFGNAQSGLITVTTKTGGSRFAGSVAYETDEPMGAGHGAGFNRVEASLSGPLYKNLTWAISGEMEGRAALDRGWNALASPEYVMAGVDTVIAVPSLYGSATADTTLVAFPNFAIASGDCDEFSNSVDSDIKNNYGIDCRGVQSPYTPRGSYRVSGKLNYTYGTGSRFSLTGIRNQTNTRLTTIRPFNNFFTLAPGLNVANSTRNQAYIFNWTQNLSKSADRALALEVYGSYQEDKVVIGQLTAESELSTRDAFGGFLALKNLDFLYDFDNFPINEARVRAWRTNDPTVGAQTPLDFTKNYQSSTVYRMNPYGLSATQAAGVYATSGLTSVRNVQMVLSRERRYIGRANLDWQLDRYNRVKLGGEYTLYKLQFYQRGATTQDICFCNIWVESPIRYNGFIQDRLDLGDVIIDGGVRYDYYDSRAAHQFYSDSGYQFPTIYSTNLATPKRDESHSYVSPHIQVSFPVTDRTNFRLSYAHQVQAPDWGLVLGGLNTDLDKTNTNQLWGTDLDFAKTVTFEFGIRHSFSDDMVLDIAAYNKDKLADASARIFKVFDPIANTNNDLRYYVNADFGTIRGVDIRLDRRFGQLFNGTLAYTFQNAQNTGTDPNSYVSYFANIPNPDPNNPNGPPPQAILPTTDSRPHNLAGAAALTFPDNWKSGSTVGSILENVGLFATFRLASGTAYTRCPSDPNNPRQNLFVFSPNLCDEGDLGGNEVNRSRLPMFKQFDLKLSKSFGFGSRNLTLYADVRNVFNFRNVLQVFTLTGTPENDAAFNRVTFVDDSADLALEALLNGAYDAGTGEISLTNAACATWLDTGNRPAGPNCWSLIRAEQRFGNGDRTFTVAEQRAASRAQFDLQNGLHNFIGAPRRVRLGIEFNF
jgi:hypothetical protein